MRSGGSGVDFQLPVVRSGGSEVYLQLPVVRSRGSEVDLQLPVVRSGGSEGLGLQAPASPPAQTQLQQCGGLESQLSIKWRFRKVTSTYSLRETLDLYDL